MTIKAMLCVSLLANAAAALHWLSSEPFHPTVPCVVIQRGIGMAYCRPENANKEVDFALTTAITEEVERECNLWLVGWWR